MPLYIVGGTTPLRIAAALFEKYRDTPKSDILPSSRQIEARKKSLKIVRKLALGYDMNTNAGFTAWVGKKEIKSKEDFYAVEDKDALCVFNFPIPDGLLNGVPGIFSQMAMNDDNKMVDCTGAVLGSIRIAINIMLWWSVNDDMLTLVLDGTLAVFCMFCFLFLLYVSCCT